MSLIDLTRRACRLGLVLLLPGIGGCASVIVDAQGRTHVLGLVWLTLPAAAERQAGADMMRARSLGVSLLRGPVGSGVVLGYSDQSLAVIRNDAAVHLPAELLGTPSVADEKGP